MSLKGQALKRAYALGHRGKCTCCVCDRIIHNRMQFNAPSEYVHSSCSKTQPGKDWVRAW